MELANQPKRRVRWNMSLSFNSEDAKRDFQEKLDHAKKSLCPGKTLDNYQFLSLILERIESEKGQIVPKLQAKSMLGKYSVNFIIDNL